MQTPPTIRVLNSRYPYPAEGSGTAAYALLP